MLKVQCDDLLAGWVRAGACDGAAALPFIDSELATGLKQRGVPGEAWRPEVTAAVRNLLRRGVYKPTGRGKPASEYLVNAFVEARFPRIFGLVDLANWASLVSALPISLIDLGRTSAREFVVRTGREGESYVFNAGGQTIDLHDLVLVAERESDLACGNAVKDSLRTKLSPEARDVMAVIYAPPALRERLVSTTAMLHAALRDQARAGSHASGVA